MAPRAEQHTRVPGKPVPIDVHHCAEHVQRLLERLADHDCGIGPEEEKRILAFYRSTRGTVSEQRSLTYLRTLVNVAQKVGKDFLKPDPKNTPERFRAAFGGHTGWTVLTSGATTVVFWKWLYAQRGEPYPTELVIRVSKRTCAKKDELDVLSPEQVASMVRVATTIRDKAFIATLYESGTRIGELLAARVGDVERSDHGALRLHVTGKTGARTIPLFEASVPLLGEWLKGHPQTSDPRALLFCGMGGRSEVGAQMDYAAWCKILRNAGRRAGITKKVHPHIFRHSRATQLALNPGISGSILEDFFGWYHGSPMANVYIHHSGKQVESSVAAALGIKKIEQPAPSAAIPRTCVRCDTLNEAANSFCGKCGNALDIISAVEAGKDAEYVNRLRDVLLMPEVRELLAPLLAKAKAAA